MSREEIIAANPIADFVRSRGHELKAAGENFVTNGCPVKQHKKYHRPNTINPAKNLWHCNDCGGGGTVIDWLSKEKRIPIADAMRELGGGKNDSEPVAMYDYTDEHDELLYQVCRFDPKDFRARRGPDDRQCKLGIKGVRRVLYRLPEVIKAQLVCIAEGEKNADDLSRLGFVATTNVFGAGKWRDEYNEFLLGKDVVVFGDVGDPDKKGEQHTEQVIASLLSSGIAARHALQPDGFHDVSDYITSLPANAAAQAVAKLIDEAKFAPTPRVEAQPRNGETVELPPAPPPYIPPPLTLLPPLLQEYVHAAADSLNVDVAYPFLPLLSSLGCAIGNARSIILKPGFIQPPVIWTGVIGPTGSLKSPALEAGFSPVLEHERELRRLNQQAQERFEEDYSIWKSENSKKRGPEPEKPVILTCLMDDLTIEALSDRLATNPRGVLVGKDEISHWFASFDQYKSGAKGSDVSRWLSLHTAVFLAVDRLKDNRHHRIWMPRVCITGGIQPKILSRVLKEEFFERGLPARFLFAYPKTTQPQWSEETISDEVQNRVLKLFADLWLLQPEHDEHDQPRPKLLRLDAEAKQIFVRFYNKCGAASVEADEHSAAAWNKLSGYAARLALVGQLARDPNAERVTDDAMKAACDLAEWFGREGVRIYASLSETEEQWERRELVEFIERRGGAVYERDVMQSFTRLKNNKAGTEQELTALVNAGLGKWEPVPTTEKGGRPARKFRYLGASTSTQPAKLPSVAIGSVDVDSSNSHKITEAETLVGDESGVVRL